MRTLPGILGFCLLILTTSCGRSTSSNNDLPQAPEQSVSETTPSSEPKRTILFFGNSLTAGYGLEPEQAFPNLIQQILDSLGYSYQVINAGLSGETSASGVNRIEWVLRAPVDILVLELGGNDGLRGIDPQVMKNNLQEIIDIARREYPQITIILAGMEAPPNMGQDYINAFRNVFPQLAEENQLPLIPFLLEGVGGEVEFNLPDGIHPNEKGHEMVASNVWKVLQDQLALKEPITDGGN